MTRGLGLLDSPDPFIILAPEGACNAPVSELDGHLAINFHEQPSPQSSYRLLLLCWQYKDVLIICSTHRMRSLLHNSTQLHGSCGSRSGPSRGGTYGYKTCRLMVRLNATLQLMG